MGDVDDLETKLKIYMLITNRYKDLIAEKEERSISEIRQKVSPYNDFIRQKKDSIVADFRPYEYGKHFFTAVQRALNYVRTIRNCEFLLTFWMSFEEMESLRAADVMDKCILFAALLRALGSEDVKVHVTRAKRVFVGFNWSGIFYLVDVKNAAMLSGPEADGIFLKDPLVYEFSDLVYESFEE
jgi:hypothetical protein